MTPNAAHAGIAASPWVQRWSTLVPRGASVVDLACGSGRHVRWFAARGARVTALDRDAQALAALEGIAYRLAIIHERLLPSLPAEHQIIASGGALLSSPAWMQIMADVLGRPVTALLEKEITARGLAVLALEILGQNPEMQLTPALGNVYRPIQEHHQLHQKAMLIQQERYRLLLGGAS